MKCKICGNETFITQQTQMIDVLVDGEGNLLEVLAVASTKAPTGPYICAQCGAEYDTLNKGESE